jgi:hypothetical protein
MLCCIVGGLLVAALARSTRRRRGHSPLLALAFGVGSGALAVELVLTTLGPLGSAKTSAPLAARLAFLVVPALLAAAAGVAGAAGSLLVRPGVATVTAAAVAGAVLAEDLDLHIVRLHTTVGTVAAVAVHAAALFFVAAGLRWRSKLPPVPAGEASGCHDRPGAGAPSPVGRVVRPGRPAEVLGGRTATRWRP